MKKILLVCNAGMSTSLLVTKMSAAAKDQGIETEIWAVPSSEFVENIEKADVCLVGPQIRFMVGQFSKQTEKPVEAIDMVSYGKMDGAAVLKRALEILDK